MEVAGRLTIENQVLGILAIVTGFLSCLLLLIRVLAFRYRDLSFESSFVVIFLVFSGVISFGTLVTYNPLSIGNMVGRYYNRFNNYIQLYNEQSYELIQRPTEAYNYSQFDSIAQELSYRSSVKAFTVYASKKYYENMLSNSLYMGLCEVMSLYRVMLEEFSVSNNDPDEVLDPDPEAIIEYMSGSHPDLSIFFAACLKHLDYPVRVRKNIHGRLVTEIRISTGTYFDLDNFFLYEHWDFVLPAWYIQEFTVDEPDGVSHIVPLYIPVHSIVFKVPCEENSNVKFLSVDLK